MQVTIADVIAGVLALIAIFRFFYERRKQPAELRATDALAADDYASAALNAAQRENLILARLDALEEKLHAKDDEIEALKETVEDLGVKIASRDSEILELRKLLGRRDNQINELERLAKKQAERIEELQAEIAGLHGQAPA